MLESPKRAKTTGSVHASQGRPGPALDIISPNDPQNHRFIPINYSRGCNFSACMIAGSINANIDLDVGHVNVRALSGASQTQLQVAVGID